MHDVSLALEIILDGPLATLWDSRIKRETLRFLRKRGKDILGKDFSLLIKAILIGPPREQFRADLTGEEWNERRDHQIRLLLFKLMESGVALPKSAQKVYDRIQHNLPWHPLGDRSEEFPFFMSTGWVNRDDPGTMEDFANMSTEEFIQWARTQTGAPWECGGGWHVFVENEPETAFKLLSRAAERKAWLIPPWHIVLSRFTQSVQVSKTLNRELAATLGEMPIDELAKVALQASQWLEHIRKSLPKSLRQSLWRCIWRASLLTDVPKGDLDFDLTLNHAGGVLGGILYDEMAEYITRVDVGEHPGLPKKLHADFEEVAEGNEPSAKLARVRMAPMLYILNRADPEWTERALLSRMDVGNSETFDPFLWEGFFWHAQWSDDLLIAFKVLLFNVLRNLDRIPESSRDHGPQMFIHMAIPPNRGIDVDEAKGVLFNMEPESLADASSALKATVQAAGDKAPSFWRETVGPWFDKAWPKRSGSSSIRLSRNFAWMAMNAGDAFPDVVAAVDGLLIPEEWESSLRHLMTKEEKNGLVSRFPDDALTLIDKLTGDETQIFDEMLKNFLNTINKANANLRNTESFKRLALRAQWLPQT